jgi:hypothetical protein
MRWLFALLVFLPTSAFAEAQINVRIEFNIYRVSPDPGPKHNHVDFVFTLRDDGTVGQEVQETGRMARHMMSDSKLGKKMHVVNGKTLVRKLEFKDRVSTLTITVSGNSCHAMMTNALKPGFTAFEARSPGLGVTALIRDWRMTSSTCSIR